MDEYSGYIKRQVASRLHHPDGRVETTREPAVWTLAHHGYRGNGRLDVWVYPTKAEALREGANLAMACGMGEDDQARSDFGRGHWQKVLDRYEATHPETHLLRIQTAFLQPAE
ncbi:hypothetical protein [Streptomyces sp. IMTB 1903]|uniref:hypothetical protein n=1 Tax=Streptomyces sp. IMTB 1903 TaxID=1776680 RepID=UPI00075719EE|nr:hypothetical protein [Streptomyces sp. IMTB 1903]